MATVIQVETDKLLLDVKAMAFGGFTVATIGDFKIKEYKVRQSLQHREELILFKQEKNFKEMGGVGRLIHAADISQALNKLHEQGYIAPAL
jgi:hypothetical protein